SCGTSVLTLGTAGLAGTAGTVTPQPAGTSCGAGCGSYHLGDKVTLTAKATSPAIFGAWEGDCAGQGATCTLVMQGPKTATAHFRPGANLMFVTSNSVAAWTLGADLSGGDAFCVGSARAAFLGGSHWKAWLSSSKVNARAHVGPSTTGWLRVDGRPCASSMT